jgi:hypothetical protein
MKSLVPLGKWALQNKSAVVIMKLPAPQSPISGRGIRAELRHSRPGFALKSFAAVRPRHSSLQHPGYSGEGE